MRLTTPEADFTLQTADDCQPDSRTQSAPDPERRAIKTGSQHLVHACTRAFLPTPALLVGQDLAFISILPRPAMHSLAAPWAPKGSPFSHLCAPPPQPIAESCSTNFRQLQQELGAGRIREENCSYTEGWGSR